MRTLGLLLLLPLQAIAQPSQPARITFDLIGVNEGLPHALVECFMLDDRGSLWVGMQQGLAVYDGSAFVPVDLEGSGMPIGVRALAKDARGNLWVASENGPVQVDPITRKAELLPFPDSLHFGVKTLWFHAVAVTKPGEVLFGTNNGTFLYDERTRAFKGLRNGNGTLIKTFWKFFHADSTRQGVWISTHQWGLVFYHSPSGKLYEPAGDSSISPLIGQYVVSLCPDGEGGLWCSDQRTGQLKHWDGRSPRVRTWDHVPGDSSAKVTRTWFLGRDRSGRIWGSALKPGGFVFDPKDSSAMVFPAADRGPGALPDGAVNDMHLGANGVIWLATTLGIAIHDPAEPQPQVFELPARDGKRSTQRIWAMEFAGDTVLWCAMGPDGLARIDLRTGMASNIPLGHQDQDELFVWDLVVREDAVHAACSDKLLRIDHVSQRVSVVDVRDEQGREPEPGRRWLADGKDGSLWMGLDLVPIMHIEPATGRTKVFRPDSAMTDGLFLDASYTSITMADGRTWICRNLRGLAVFDPRTGAWTEHVRDVDEGRLRVARILGMTAAGDSVLWLASDGAGLVRYHIPTGRYTHYDKRHGITELGLYTVAIDGRGRVWANSDERVFCFDPQRERAVVVDPRSTTGGDAPKWVLGMSRGGLLSMNIGHEVAVFDADAVGADRTPPAPMLARILVDGAALAMDADNRIEMGHDAVQLEVHFGAVLPPGTTIAYGMRAPGEEWSESSEGRVNLRGLRPGEHVFEFRIRNQQGAWGPATTLHVRIPPPWWQTLLARIVFALLLALAIVLLFRARLEWVRKRERAQEEQARQVNELKLQALRAQMDPHFVFNCLNSIDSFIIANDREQASHYLGRFAKLIRLILQHSDSARVPLEREVEMLRYYLELEALRFKTPFTFNVDVDEELEGEPVELPTMLIQPYIENAIWHGLRHKGTAGHLNVLFALREDRLECTVEDNGIGREASRELNKQRSSVHRSMGMRVSADRMKLYGELEQGASRVEITDLMDAQGNAAGTRVVIHIPVFGGTMGD